jgi:glyoxylase-like metal-dependent hydrolase (beta-lactamase superfamily II)
MLELAERGTYQVPRQVEQLSRAGAPSRVMKAICDVDMPFDRSEWELPDAWVKDEEAFILPGGGALRAIHTPGHTAGHTVFLDEENRLLFGGDHVLPHITPSIGYEQVPSPQPLRDFIDSLERLASLPDAMLLPGHGPTGASVPGRLRVFHRVSAGPYRRRAGLRTSRGSLPERDSLPPCPECSIGSAPTRTAGSILGLRGRMASCPFRCWTERSTPTPTWIA